MSNRPTTEERLGKSPQRLVRYFLLAMALIYVGLGVWALWSAGQPGGDGIFQLPPTARRVLGTVLILYGLLRLGRVYQAYFHKQSPFTDPNDHV